MTLQKTFVTLGALLALAGCGGHASDTPDTTAATLSATHRAVQAGPDSHTALLQQLYVGFFGRPADPAGLAYHAASLARLQAPTTMREFAAAYRSRADIRAFAGAMADSAETRDLYGGAPERLIAALYRNSFNRDPDAAGLQYWVDAIDRQGLEIAAAVVTILEGAQGSDLLTFERKADAARRFTGALDRSGATGLYSDHGPIALARDLLQSLHSGSTDGEIDADIAAGIAALQSGQGWVMVDGHAEVPGGARSVALLVGPSQPAAVRTRVESLAAVLAADLNARAGRHGATWRVDVLQAAATVPAVRAQLQGRDGAILVGDVVVPTGIDAVNGDTVPDLTPYRTPDCTRYRFPAGTRVVAPAPGSDHAWVHSEDPACRNGMTVSVLRGASPLRQSAELTAKLDQMIAYHRGREQADAAWLRTYQRIDALWLRDSAPAADGRDFWKDIPLFERSRIAYLERGTGQQRLDAFRACLSGANEMCTFSGHGARDLIVSEGPDASRPTYSSDAVYFTSSDLKAMPVRAKFVNLQSCSTQNFLYPQSFGSTMLHQGDALLVLGSTAVTVMSNWVDKEAVQSMYQPLVHGATFAEAFAGQLDGAAWGLQGDPFISLRPKPAGAQPKLVVDGRHFNVHPAIARLALGDSSGGAPSTRTVVLANRGDADLHLRLGIMATNVTARDRVLNPNGGDTFNLGFMRAAPDANRESGYGNVGDIVHVVPPGGELAVRLSFEALVNASTGRRSRGPHTGTYEIQSNDPQSPRIVFELAANAR